MNTQTIIYDSVLTTELPALEMPTAGLNLPNTFTLLLTVQGIAVRTSLLTSVFFIF